MVLPLFSANGLLSRLTSIFLGFAPPFLLLSIGYISFISNCNGTPYLTAIWKTDSFFSFHVFLLVKFVQIWSCLLRCSCSCTNGMDTIWNTVLYLSKVKKPSSSIKIVEDHLTLDHDTRCLQLSDVRIPLIFVSHPFLLITFPFLNLRQFWPYLSSKD